MRTQVVIVGGGPAGLMLAQILALSGVSSIILERRDKTHVLSRIRAGVLESGSVDLLRANGLGERLDREGLPHAGVLMTWSGLPDVMIDGPRYAARGMMIYGQTRITEDLYAARAADGQQIIENVEDVVLHDLTGPAPFVTFLASGETSRIDCDFIAGCDGFHGVSRRSIPAEVRREYERVYPFSWLGILAETPPLPEVTYATGERGFALASQRSPTLSRNYIQIPTSDRPEDWPDERFWTEFVARLPNRLGAGIRPAPSIEKSMTPLRSFVCEPMRYGRLFLAGDAAHVVPPTGAKGLNLAFSDVHYLSRALVAFYQGRGEADLEAYSARALTRVWNGVRLSWWLTTLLHVFPSDSGFDRKLRESEYLRLAHSEAALTNLVEQFVGTPL